MATVTDFRELKCWQQARVVAKEVYSLSRQGAFAKDYGLRDQIQRAAVSIGSNIAEGFERGSNQDFQKFLSYAKGSAGEVISQLYTAYDVGYLTQESFGEMVDKLKSVGAMMASLQSKLKSSTMRGLYHKQPETRNSEPETRN